MVESGKGAGKRDSIAFESIEPPLIESVTPKLCRRQGDVGLDDCCPICFEPYSIENNDAFVIPGCKHRFHTECLRDWSTRQQSYDRECSTCPICRHDLSSIQSYDMNDQDAHSTKRRRV